MSFDPFGYDPHKQPPQGQGQGQGQPQGPPPDAMRPLPPDGTAPIPYQMSEPPSPQSSAQERVQLPGVFLIALGLLNVLWTLLLAFVGFSLTNFTPEMLDQVKQQANPQQRAQIEDAEAKGLDVVKFFQGVGVWIAGFGGAALLASLLMIVGGVRMMQLRSYGLAVLASVVTAVPIVSAPACPCIVGVFVGIWCVIVLVSPDVRAAFR